MLICMALPANGNHKHLLREALCNLCFACMMLHNFGSTYKDEVYSSYLCCWLCLLAHDAKLSANHWWRCSCGSSFWSCCVGKRLDLIFLWIDAEELPRCVNDVLRKGRPASRVVDECLLQPKRTKAKDTEWIDTCACLVLVSSVLTNNSKLSRHSVSVFCSRFKNLIITISKYGLP